MKRNIWLAIVLVIGSLGMTACGNGQEQAAESPEAEQENGEVPKEEIEENFSEDNFSSENPSGEETEAAKETEADGNIYVEMEEYEQEYKAEDGTVLLTVENSWPVVVISDNEQAAGAINEEILSSFSMDETEIRQWAEEDYAERGKENWRNYAFGTGYGLQRADAEVISFRVNSYWDMGGAHPNSMADGMSFSVRTGERLTLADVTVDEETVASAVRAFLLEETKKEEYGGMFYEDYEESIGDILTEETWYLGEDGFHIIVNEYIIAPHAAGILDFVIPYGEADFLKEEYRK